MPAKLLEKFRNFEMVDFLLCSSASIWEGYRGEAG